MPADVFKALDDIEYGFMREKLEAEFASELPPTHSLPFQNPAKSLKHSPLQNSTKSKPPNAPPTVRR